MKSWRKKRRGNNPKHKYGICRVYLDSKDVLMRILADIEVLRRTSAERPARRVRDLPRRERQSGEAVGGGHLKFIYRLRRPV